MESQKVMINSNNSLKQEIMIHKILRELIMNSKHEQMDAMLSTILASRVDKQSSCFK